MVKLSKDQLAIYAAGVYDAGGAISATRPLASAAANTKKHDTLSRLQQAFGGELEESAGTGRGEGKTFIQWYLSDTKDRKKFFNAILPYSVASETIAKHLSSL